MKNLLFGILILNSMNAACQDYNRLENFLNKKVTGVISPGVQFIIADSNGILYEYNKGLANIENGDKVDVESARGKIWAVAMVTHRFRPFKIQGNVIHQVGLPWHFGWVHPKDGGDSANLLTPSAGDPNTRIPETKAFMVNVKKA